MSGFDSFDDYLAHPRITDLALSSDGTRLVACVAALHDDGDRFVTSLWQLDPAGTAEPVRLTRSDKGESAPVFHPGGALLFLSTRGGDDDAPPALWSLPPAGEPEQILTRPGGVSAALVARDAATVVVRTTALPGSTDAESDEQRRTARKQAKVNAVLHTGTPVRFWDHELGPEEIRLQALTEPRSGGELVELTPTPQRALDESHAALSPDGRTLVTSWAVFDEPGFPRYLLVAIDTATGAQRVLADDKQANFDSPAVSADGRRVVCVRSEFSSFAEPPAESLRLIELDSGTGADLLADPDVWPAEPQFAPDGRTVYYLTDEQGHRPVFALNVASGARTRLTASGHHTNLQVAADGSALYALRDSIDSPPRPVRIDPAARDAVPVELPAPGAARVPGELTEVHATAVDGTPLRAYLARPVDTSAEHPAPLQVWMHGGPLSSWNGWSWRWNPWLMVARGYAVLLPDPALSTGYGIDMIARGWGAWGGAPFTDVMALTDVTVARPDIDQTKTAALGGSYGGYLANWTAGHTDRFCAIVTHASLWAVDQFQGTTDVPGYWVREWGQPDEHAERYRDWSPHHSLANITTPMLVIHGDKDYRVPVSEALRLWWDLQRSGVESAYLSFPDEGHWVLKPGNARVWYETIWAWLDTHLHGADWRQPDLL